MEGLSQNHHHILFFLPISRRRLGFVFIELRASPNPENQWRQFIFRCRIPRRKLGLPSISFPGTPDILDILKAEQAPLDLWLIIAREYFKQGKLEQFRQILEEGSSPEIDEYYADVRYERIAILNALGAYYSYIGKIETKQREKEEHFILATQFYNKASKIDIHEPSTWVVKGQLLLANGEVDQAFNAFKIVLDEDRDKVPSLLGQACVEFNRGQFSDSLELHKRALQVNHDCPVAVRLGIGLCRYKMGQFEKAWQAFHLVLELDPENVEALVALAILDLHTNVVDSGYPQMPGFLGPYKGANQHFQQYRGREPRNAKEVG